MEPGARSEDVRALLEGAAGVWLDDRAVITVRGEDRVRWLGGMVTADLRGLVPGKGVYTALVAVKGKLLGDAYVHLGEDCVLLLVPSSERQAIVDHLEGYIVMEDATVESTSERVLTVQGPLALTATEGMGGRSTADRLGVGGVDVLFPPTEEVPEALAVVPRAAFDAACVERRVPQWGIDFGGDNFVQEVGITDRAVSFQKGCYVGQEVVCRLQKRGQVQKLLVPLRVLGVMPVAGAEVLVEGKAVGRVTSVARALHEPDAANLLAMVRYAVVDKRPPLEVDGAPAAWLG